MSVASDSHSPFPVLPTRSDSARPLSTHSASGQDSSPSFRFCLIDLILSVRFSPYQILSRGCGFCLRMPESDFPVCPPISWQPGRNWLGSSLSSEPRGWTGLSVASHAGVLARSKISGSLLHRLSRPWHGLGPGGSHRDQRYGAAPKFSSPAEGDGSSSCLAFAASASSSSDFRCCSFILERRLAKQFSHDTKLLKLNQTRDGEACVCWSSLNDPRVR